MTIVYVSELASFDVELTTYGTGPRRPEAVIRAYRRKA